MAEYAQMNPGIHHVGHRFVNSSSTQRLPEEVNKMVNLKFKAAVIANRTVYVGNVQRTDLKGQVTVENDSMYKSGVNKFDQFADFRRIDVSIRDGDEIVQLAEYADRILQFKKLKMHLLNVSQEIEFLEDTFIHKGVSHPAAVCKTDYGVAWVNHLGCYLYDGKQVMNLLEKGGRQIIKEEEWFGFLTPGKDASLGNLNGFHTGADNSSTMTDSTASFVADALIGGIIYNVTDGSSGVITDNTATTVVVSSLSGGSDNSWDAADPPVDAYRLDITETLMTPMIGYLPKKRQLVVFDDITNTGRANPRMYLYDMVTQSWVKGAQDSNRNIDIDKTNFVNDWNGDLVYAHTTNTGTVLKWDDASSSSDTLILKTKDIDFGQPGVRKKVYKVHITYKGDGRYVKIYFGVDGLDPSRNFFPITSGTDGSSAGGSGDSSPLADAGTTDWLKAELKPSSSINNISSFRLLIEGNTGGTAIDSAFEINDISIVYRLKPVR